MTAADDQAAPAVPFATSSPGQGRKPEWLKKPLPRAAALRSMEGLLRGLRLHTVCENALCPNLGECFERGTATFLILGDVCTRDCGFCGVQGGVPLPPDSEEPERVAEAVVRLGLRHVVVTSVTRDDLPDGGAAHYVAVLRAVRRVAPQASLEVLVPDFRGDMASVDLVLRERPEVFNHNLETVPRLYPEVRPQADYSTSLAVLARAAESGSSLVKTGLMVGLGEAQEEVRSVLRDAASSGVDVVTIGQYLRPSASHVPVVEYVAPALFAAYAAYGRRLGLQVHAGPFVRSSYRANESLEEFLGRTHGQCLQE